MQFQKESFFKIFEPKLRRHLQWFFENRRGNVTLEMVNGAMDTSVLEKLIALELVERDDETGEYRLDDRVEQFFNQMLGAIEVAQAEWLTGLIEEIHRAIEGCKKLPDSAKHEVLLRRICRLLNTCNSRVQRHLEEVKAAVDFDYRTGSDYDVKLLKLQWHLERTQSYGQAVAELDNLLRNDAFFHVHQEIELVSLRGRVIHRCSQVGDALIDIYQRIEEHLNRVLRDYARARKLIQLCSLIERHEHLTSTNLKEATAKAEGPWFHDFRFRTLLDPSVIDGSPELLARTLKRMGLSAAGRKAKRIQLNQQPSDDTPPVIDWQNVYEAFAKQKENLFVFLGKVVVDGRRLTDEERIDGYCAILTNEDWAEAWSGATFDISKEGEWEFAVINPAGMKL